MLFGWDISTAIIGFASFDDNGKFLSGSFCDLRKVDDFMVKADTAAVFVYEMIFSQPFAPAHVHFIEDKLSGMGGGSNAGTIMRLGAFNAMVSWMVWQNMREADTFHHLHPSTVKAIMKKEGLVVPKGGNKKLLTLNFVRNREPTFPYVTNKNDNPQPYCYDQADAYITARAGFLKHLKNVVK